MGSPFLACKSLSLQVQRGDGLQLRQ